jgi:hypothetical protein
MRTAERHTTAPSTATMMLRACMDAWTHGEFSSVERWCNSEVMNSGATQAGLVSRSDHKAGKCTMARI